ncbi:S-adenosyl-L-methionine-dependent methyltransferase [Chytridium lagenaria]|nr:S-adenosyl-L-methionine-dependent methyltransferase [Chytridium lagenaria]
MTDPTPILELLNAFRRSKIMMTFVTTHLVDILDLHGPLTSHDIVTRLPTLKPDAVDRLLRACVPLGLVNVNIVNGTRRFELTPIKQHGSPHTPSPIQHTFTKSNTPHTGYVWHSDQTLYPIWTHLSHSLQTSQPTWSKTFPTLFPTPPTNPFSVLYADTPSFHRFQDAMHSHAVLSAPSIVAAIPEGPYKTVMDVGGATGALAVEVVRRWDVDCVVVDLREVVETTREKYLTVERVRKDGESDEEVQRILGKVSTLAADFFVDAFPSTDMAMLSRSFMIGMMTRLPRFCAKYVVGFGDDAGPMGATLQDINMMVQTGGRERSEEEFREMLQEAGFVDVVVVRTGKYLDVVLGYKRKGAGK